MRRGGGGGGGDGKCVYSMSVISTQTHYTPAECVSDKYKPCSPQMELKCFERWRKNATSLQYLMSFRSDVIGFREKITNLKLP